MKMEKLIHIKFSTRVGMGGEDILQIRQPINPNPWELGLEIRYISWKFLSKLYLRKFYTKGVRALRGYFGPPMRSKNKSCSLQVSLY